MSKDPEIRRVNQALNACLKKNDCFTCSYFMKRDNGWGHCSRFYRFIQFPAPRATDARKEEHALPGTGATAAPGL